MSKKERLLQLVNIDSDPKGAILALADAAKEQDKKSKELDEKVEKQAKKTKTILEEIDFITEETRQQHQTVLDDFVEIKDWQTGINENITKISSDVLRLEGLIADIKIPDMPKVIHGKDGRDGRDGIDGLIPVKGVHFFDGEKGEQGDIGPMPKHEWNGTWLRFEESSGVWGKWKNLVGEKGTKSNVIHSGGRSIRVSDSGSLVSDQAKEFDFLTGFDVTRKSGIEDAFSISVNAAEMAPLLDHGLLSGLGDDDHPQYIIETGDTMLGSLHFGNTIETTFGGTRAQPKARFLFEVADADANMMHLILPDGDDTNSPILAIGNSNLYGGDVGDLTGIAANFINSPALLILDQSATEGWSWFHDGTFGWLANTTDKAIFIGANNTIIHIQSNAVGSTGTASLALGDGSDIGTKDILFKADFDFDQGLVALNSTVGRQLIITDISNEALDHGIATQTNPTLYGFSATGLGVATDEWWSITQDTTQMSLQSGSDQFLIGESLQILKDGTAPGGTSKGIIAWPGGSRLYEQSDVQRFFFLPNGDRWEVLNESGGTLLFGVHGANSSLSNRTISYNGLIVGAVYAATAPPSNGMIVVGDVGLGTNTPETDLHVKGGVNTFLTYQGRADFGSSIWKNLSGTVMGYFGYSGTGGYIAGSLDDGMHLRATNGLSIGHGAALISTFSTAGVTMAYPLEITTTSQHISLVYDGTHNAGVSCDSRGFLQIDSSHGVAFLNDTEMLIVKDGFNEGAFKVFENGNPAQTFEFNSQGKMLWSIGDGSAADVQMFRRGVGVLQVLDELWIGPFLSEDYYFGNTNGSIWNVNQKDFDSFFRSVNDPNNMVFDAGNDRVGFGTATPLTKVHVVGGATITQEQIGGITEVTTATYAALSTDYHISIQYTLTGIQTTTLPAITATNHGQEYHLKDADYNAAINNILVNTTGSDTIEGQASGGMIRNGESWTLIANNTTKNWELQ